MSTDHLFVVLPSSDDALAHREALTRAGIAHTVVAHDGRGLPPESPVLIVSPEAIGLLVDEQPTRLSRTISPDDLAAVVTALFAMRRRAAEERLVMSMKTHDAGNLLHSIVSSLHLLLDDRHATDADLVEDIEEASVRLAQLLRQGPRAIAPRPIDVRLVITGMLRLLHATPGVPVVLAPIPDVFPQVAIVPLELERAIGNLVCNARRASREGDRVVIAISPHDGGVAIDVIDRGVGMSAATLARAFEPFFTTREDGQGLGLASVRRIAEQVGGRVEIESELGRGTRVRLWLPAAR